MFKFPYTNFHEMNLTWIIETVKNLTEEWIEMQGKFTGLQGDFEELKKFVTDYFAKLEIDKEVRKILDEMKANGELSEIISDALLQGALARVNKPTVLILGDSYGAGENIANKEYSWAYMLKNALEKNGYSVKLSAIGGCGFKADGTKTYTNMLNTLAGTMTTNEKKNVVKIIVGGSYNDRNSAENDISQGMIDFQSAIASNFENCKNVVVCPMGWTWEGHQQGIHTSTTYISVIKAIKIWMYSAAQLGFSVIPAYQGMLYESSFSNDGVHPSEQGHKNILNMVIGAFDGLYFKPINSIEYGTTFKKTSSIPGKGGAKIRYSIFNGTAKVRCLEFKLSEINIPNLKLDGTPLEVGTIDSPAIHFYATDCTFPCSMILKGKETDTAGEANLFTMVQGSIKISEKKVYLIMQAINTAKRNYLRYDINQIECVDFGDFVFDPLFQ
jgi:lysophospholipase L1-like esterase|nr:MAG TPA: hydrolase [Caudoviricetes sp.]